MQVAPQHWIGASWFENASERFDKRIKPWRRVFHVNIHPLGFESQTQFRIIIKRRTGLAAQSVSQRPIQQITKRDVIQIQFICD